MKKLMTTLLAGSALALSTLSALAELKELNVAYFLEWPMPMMEAKANGAYDKALGMKVNWVSFETGTAMSAAMASGDGSDGCSLRHETVLYMRTQARQYHQRLSL